MIDYNYATTCIGFYYCFLFNNCDEIAFVATTFIVGGGRI